MTWNLTSRKLPKTTQVFTWSSSTRCALLIYLLFWFIQGDLCLFITLQFHSTLVMNLISSIKGTVLVTRCKNLNIIYMYFELAHGNNNGNIAVGKCFFRKFYVIKILEPISGYFVCRWKFLNIAHVARWFREVGWIWQRVVSLPTLI